MSALSAVFTNVYGRAEPMSATVDLKPAAAGARVD